MPGLLYYLPNAAHSVTRDELAAAGLAYALDRHAAVEVRRGPGEGAPGLVVADPRHVERIGYYPDRQEWRQAPGKPWWCGRYTDAPILPADLARAKQLPGHWVELADQQRWLCPVARGVSEQDDQLGWYCALPERLTLDGTGEWTRGGVLTRYRHLWDLALRWYDTWLGAEAGGEDAEGNVRVRLAFGELVDGAVACLGANYRVSAVECDLLGLLDPQSARDILHALIDWPTIEAFVQKKMDREAAAGSFIASGATDAPEDTGPHSPTSGPPPSALETRSPNPS